MKIVATSDLHGAFPDVPPCDLLLVGGDVCPIEGSHEVHDQRFWLRNAFKDWLLGLPAKEIVWIGGNHDFACEQPGFHRIAERISDEIAERGGPKVVYLEDEVHDVDGLRIFGAPWTPNLRNWAFYKDDPDFFEWAKKLPDADIYLLHSPPAGILCGGHNEWGSPGVASAIVRKKKPARVVFGHIHEGYGVEEIGEYVFHNVAHMDEFYDPIHPVQEFEL